MLAQESLRIAAVVNEDIISALDLQARLRLIITMSQLPNTDETFRSLAPATLRALVDEKLKFQEAEVLDIAVEQSEIDRAISLIETRNRLTPNTLIGILEKNAINPETLFDQIRSEIIWSRIVSRKHGERITIADEDIDKAVREEEAAQNQPRYHLSEIAIPVETPENITQVSEQVMSLSAQLESGADFGTLAQSFSQSPSAARGGDISWLTLDQLPPEVGPAVSRLQPGQVTRPIRITAGFVLIKLHEIRSGTTPQQPESILKLNQLHLPLPVDAPEETVSLYMQSARDATESTQGCEAFDVSIEKIGSPLSGSLGEVSLSKLPPVFQDALRSLPVGKASAPIRSPEAVIVLMVCERKDIPAPDSSVDRKRIEQRIFTERLTVYARQEIRELRRAAYIELR